MSIRDYLKLCRGPVALFCLVLCYFVVQSGWYEPAQLIIRGNLFSERADLEVRWDSGAGFNSYERKRFHLNQLAVQEPRKHHLVVRCAATNNSASLGNDVFVHRIAVDGKNLDLAELARNSGFEMHERNLRLSERKQELVLDVDAHESILVEMLTNNFSGNASVGVDGIFRDRDLYAANEKSTSFTFEHWLVGDSGGFVIKSDMPRYRIRSLQVRNVDIRGQLSVSTIGLETGEKKFPLFSGDQKAFAEILLSGPSKAQKRYFSPVQFAYDVVFAGLTTWLFIALCHLYRSCRGGIFSGPRRVFWFFFLGCLVTYSIWLLAFWPGVASVDSLKIWRAAILPGIYLDDHPLLNVILYKYLAHFWANMAVVPLFHIVSISALFAAIFYFLYRRGISLVVLVPFHLLLLLSLPIGLYNIILWKDIPFALVTVLWGFLFVVLYWKRVDGTLRYTKQQIAVLLLIFIAVALIRHNGAVYLLVIPLYFISLRLLSQRFALFFFLISAGSLALAVFILIHYGWIASGGYFFSQGLGFLQKFMTRPFTEILAAACNNYWQIFNVNQTVSAWDLFHKYLGDRTAYPFLNATGWSDVYSYLPPGQSLLPSLKGLAMNIYNSSYATPYVYFTWNPGYFLAGFLLVILLFRKFPSAAIFSSFILVQVFTLLVFVNVMNWRYYYFAFLGGYLLVPFMLLDLQQRRAQKRGMAHEV